MRRVSPRGGAKELTVSKLAKVSKFSKEFKDFTFLMETMPGDGHCLFHTVIYAEKCLVEGSCLPSIRLQEAMDQQGSAPEVPAFEVTVHRWKEAVAKASIGADAPASKDGKEGENRDEVKKASKGSGQDASTNKSNSKAKDRNGGENGGKDPNLRVYTWKKGPNNKSGDQFFKQRVSDEEVVLCTMVGQPSKYTRFTVTVSGPLLNVFVVSKKPFPSTWKGRPLDDWEDARLSQIFGTLADPKQPEHVKVVSDLASAVETAFNFQPSAEWRDLTPRKKKNPNVISG